MNFQQLLVLRPDLAFIGDWVQPSSRVLDVGCGDGAMLAYLDAQKSCSGYGLEIDDEQVARCIAAGVPVLQMDMRSGLAQFDSDSFDCVLCLSALQMARDVEGVLRELARVGQQVIVSFPNFAYWRHRLALLQGRMPVSPSLPYQWYETPNVRYATQVDFKRLANQLGLDVEACVALNDGHPVRWLPNLRGTLAVFRLTKR